MNDSIPPYHTYRWACPRCHGNNLIASEVERTDVKCGWCGHVIDAQQCRADENNC